MASHVVMPEMVAELVKLIKDHDIFSGRLEFPTLIKDLLHIAFCSWRSITSPATFESHSKRSRLIPSGRIAITRTQGVVHCMRRHDNNCQLKARPLFLSGRSNCPVTNFGTKQPNAAPTLCAPVGNHFPTKRTIRASTPVNTVGVRGNSHYRKSPPILTGSFFQVIRNRL